MNDIVEGDYDSDIEQTASIITSGGSDKSDCDIADKIIDGYINPDGPDHSWLDALWSSPNEVITDEDAEARIIFDKLSETGSQTSCPGIAELEDLEVRSYKSDATDDEPENGSSKKQSSAQTDSATSQNINVINKLLSLIEEQGGWSNANLSWIDFESAAQLTSTKCAPCETGVHFSTLSMNELPTVSESNLLRKLHDCHYPENEGSPNPWLASKLEKEIRDSNIPTQKLCYYHRIIVAGLIPRKLKATSDIGRNNIHGIRSEGINGAARSRCEIFDVLRSIEECVYPTSSNKSAFRYANDSSVLRKVPPPSATRGALLFGNGVPLERAALSSLCYYARDDQQQGPYRWSASMYDAIHLIQAMSVTVTGTLLSVRALNGIALFMKSSSLCGSEDEVSTSQCKYHGFIKRRARTLDLESEFHCALEDATIGAVLIRYIARRFFPKLPVAYRNASPLKWLDIAPRKRKVQSTSPDFSRAFSDLTELHPNLPPCNWEAVMWHSHVVPSIFELIEKFIADNNPDSAGRLVNAWHIIGNSDFIQQEDDQDTEMDG